MSAKKKTKPAKSPASPAAKSKATSNPMDLGLIENMVALMSTHDLSAIEVRDGDRRIVLRRGAQLVSAAPPAAYAPAPHAAPAPSPAKSASPDTTPAPDADAGLLKITSPMVGTFYAAPSPDAKPFVQVGSQVDEDSDVCVIEAMKVFNSIKAECRGKIAKVLVTNGSTVEFGQVLFLVKP